MSKRKAQNENLNSSDTATESQTNIQSSPYLRDGANIMSSQSQSQNSQFHAPTTYPEKRKKISTTFSDLSQIGDFSGQSSQLDSSQASNTNLEATLRVVKKNNSYAPRAGTIERIEMKTFKCHSFLEVTFHPFINFILGRNGSGKSAVMDAIILCLGGKATCTGRQASAKTFIKTNNDKAELSVTLRNHGEEAYKAPIYGSKITIMRKITKDGSSQYKICDENGKLVTNKKQELDNIIEQFNIQVDNPVCFLNQETSKHFLASSNKADKYRLFMKASQLESMRMLQDKIECERQASETILRDKESHLPKLEEDLFRWEEKYKKCQSAESLKKKYNLLMIELSWAYVVETEKVIDGIMKEKKISEKAKEKHQQKIDDNDAEFERANSEFNKKKSEINELTNAIKGSGTTYEEVTAKWKKASMNVKSVQTELKKLNSQLEKKTRDSKELADKLNEEKKKNETDYHDEKSQKEATINEIKEKLKEISNMEKTKSQDNQMLSGDIEKNRRTISDKNFDLMENEKTVKKYEAEIETLKNMAKNQLCKFGDFMPELVNDVKRNFEMKKFKQMPRGPLGMYIQPKESGWTLAIEQCLGFLLTAFVCDNYDDEKVMHQLIAKHVRLVHHRPRVIVSDFSTPLYDSRRFRPDTTQYSTVYEMLNIKDNVVANTLMDQRKIESVLLLPDRQAGREVIEQNSTQNCSEAFLKNGDRYMGLPSFRMYSCFFSTPKYFIENTEGAITAKKRDITRFNEQVQAIRQEIKVLTDQLKNSQTLKQKNDVQLEALKREQLKLNNKLRDAESINIHEPVDLAVFEGEIQSIMEEIEGIKAQIQEIESNNVEVREEYERQNQEKLKYDQEKRCLDEKIEQVTRTFNSLDEERNKYKDASKYYKGLLNEVIAKDQVIDKKLADQQTEFEKMLKTAQEMSARIETKKHSKAIDNEMQTIDKQIQMSQKLHGNEEEITRKYKETRERYKKICDDMKKQRQFLKKLKEILDKREIATNNFIKAKSLRCTMEFSNYVHSRNFNGQLLFDHVTQTLDIIVQPNKQRDKQSTDLKALSGGERSFSTVAFLLSLWAIVESPILFLDEFDVFMDQVNRTFAMDLILNAAKDKLNGQYMFLTPQEMGTVKPDKYVSMFKMPDPKRSIDEIEEEE